MPNAHNPAQKAPQRTCVVCKARKDLADLLSFFILPEGIVFDPARKVQRRRNYVCPQPECLAGLDKWKKQYTKRHYNIASNSGIFSGLLLKNGTEVLP